jgi:hypothetical protein
MTNRATLVLHLLRNFLLLGLLAGVAFGQSTISGVVKDTSGAIVANASVEAASDVLIEKTRTVTTNADGRYAIVDLRPGTYIVTVTLSGFNTVKQTVVVPANVTVPVDAELKIGSVGETVNVEARVATVDIENVSHPETLTRSDLDSLPTGRYMQSIASYVPGAHLNLPDIGGSQQIEQNYISVHGNLSKEDLYMFDGMLINTTYLDGQIQQYVDNEVIAETTYQSSNNTAEASAGGMFTNIVPKEGGNQFHGDLFAGGSGGSNFWQGSNGDATTALRGLSGQNNHQDRGFRRLVRWPDHARQALVPGHRPPPGHFLSGRKHRVAQRESGRSGWIHQHRLWTIDVPVEREEQDQRVLAARLERKTNRNRRWRSGRICPGRSLRGLDVPA